MNKKIFANLARLAYDIPHFADQRVVAAVVQRNQIISYGFGHEKTHPFQARYGKNEDSIYWHAETHAIHNAIKQDFTFHRACLYVLRLKSDHSHNSLYGLAKPCLGCERCIRDFNIPKVYYTLEGEIDNRIWNYGVIEQNASIH